MYIGYSFKQEVNGQNSNIFQTFITMAAFSNERVFLVESNCTHLYIVVIYGSHNTPHDGSKSCDAQPSVRFVHKGRRDGVERDASLP